MNRIDMETMSTLKIGEKVDSPIAGFNNFMIEIGQEFNDIFDIDMYGTNNVIFENNSILLFGFIRLQEKNGVFGIKINGVVTDENQELVEKVFDNKRLIKSIFYKYNFVLNDVMNNLDVTVSCNYVDSIINDLNNKNFKTYYLVPYKNKIFKTVDCDKSVENLFNRLTYILTINENGPKQYKCCIMRMLSSDLDESKSISNIRPLEKETIKEDFIQKDKIRAFLIKLMNYGEF